MLNATDRKPLEPLFVGRRALEELRSVKLLEDWKWYEVPQRWVLRCRLSIEVGQGLVIPAESDWYVLVEETYPWGSIIFYPAQQGGITQTFPHQNYNGKPQQGLPWRTGRLCVDTSLHVLGRKSYDIEEPFDVELRLKWHFTRVLEWLIAASQGNLVRVGESYELPFYPKEGGLSLVFNEGPETFATWKGISEKAGLAKLSKISRKQNILYVKSFGSTRKEILLELVWGRMLRGEEREEIIAGWIQLNQIPVISPWQAPITWGELRQACFNQGVSLDNQIQRLAPLLRDGEDHVVLLGAPIPDRVGGPYLQFHWLALKLPRLTTAVPNGFRPNEKGRWARDRSQILSDKITLIWYGTENWNAKELVGRGVLSNAMTRETIALVGVGALGSTLGEQLVRAGAHSLIVVDGDFFEVGNIVRHTLTLDSVGANKAEAIAARLNQVSPHAEVEAISSWFPPVDEAKIAKLRTARIIVECTGADEVLKKMGMFDWGGEKIFVSISLSMWAKRVYIFVSRGLTFPCDTFFQLVGPWLKKDLEESKGSELPREGIGCWHPLFPARLDDIYLLTSIALKHLESVIENPDNSLGLAVFEQIKEGGAFVGIRKMSESEQK